MPVRYFIGLVLIVLGAGFLLEQFNALPFGMYLAQWWPMLIVAFGLNELIRHPLRPWGALFIMSIGVLLQASLIGRPVNIWVAIAAFLLVILGLRMLLPRRTRLAPATTPPAPVTNGAVSSADRIAEHVVLGESHVRNVSPHFKGGSASAVLAGCVIDLRDAALDPAGATLDLAVTLAGIKVYVPESWRVISVGGPVLGGCENRTRGPIAAAGAPVLTVNCGGILGGIEIDS
ncbi:MAG: LiaF transmembrane domain-containing protein [Armatimonadota bacterium]